MTIGEFCAERFFLEMKQRGYLTDGKFVPNMALEYPERLERWYKDSQRAGADVLEAFTKNATWRR